MNTLNDYPVFEKYGFTDGTLREIKEFYNAKDQFLEKADEDTRYMLKYTFQNAHSSLKQQCSAGIISPHQLHELTELLKRGV